jgi:hypothetical protein
MHLNRFAAGRQIEAGRDGGQGEGTRKGYDAERGTTPHGEGEQEGEKGIHKLMRECADERS